MTRRRPNPWNIMRRSIVVGIEDLRSFYTWRTWLFGWLMRMVFQVMFFALAGRFVGTPATARFLLIGSACAIAVLEALVVVLATAFDRYFGVLPLLVTAPGDYFMTYVSRNLNHIVTGVATSSLSLFIGAAILGIDLPLPHGLLVVPIIALGATSTYLFGCFLGAIVAKTVQGRWVMLNVGNMSLTALGGFVVPVGFWPQPFTVLAQILPFTHALQAVRGVLDNAPGGPLARQCAIEALVAVGWFVAAKLTLRAAIAWSRRDGSIELSE